MAALQVYSVQYTRCPTGRGGHCHRKCSLRFCSMASPTQRNITHIYKYIYVICIILAL